MKSYAFDKAGNCYTYTAVPQVDNCGASESGAAYFVSGENADGERVNLCWYAVADEDERDGYYVPDWDVVDEVD